MEDLIITATSDAPQVELKVAEGTLEISGHSMMEDAGSFFQPIKDWINEYIAHEMKSTKLIFHLDYFSSSTSKHMLQLFYIFEDNNLHDQVKIVWKYDDSDEMMKERGEEMELMIDLDFEYLHV